MLSREVMGIFALGVLWVTALLVAAAAWQDLRDVRGWWRRARRAVRGVVVTGDGDDQTLAEFRVEQRGRATDEARPAIAFHDRAFHSRVHGGTVEIDGRARRLSGPGEVWVEREQRGAAAACPGEAEFDEAYARAICASGFQRDVRVAVRAGDRVVVLGEVEGDAVVASEGPLVVATFDPRRMLSRDAWALALFIPSELLACACVTWVALRPPHFGAVSVLGAILGLAFFLGVTPVAVSLREHVRRPSEAHLRGTWARRAR